MRTPQSHQSHQQRGGAYESSYSTLMRVEKSLNYQCYMLPVQTVSSINSCDSLWYTGVGWLHIKKSKFNQMLSLQHLVYYLSVSSFSCCPSSRHRSGQFIPGTYCTTWLGARAGTAWCGCNIAFDASSSTKGGTWRSTCGRGRIAGSGRRGLWRWGFADSGTELAATKFGCLVVECSLLFLLLSLLSSSLCLLACPENDE